MKSVVNNFSPFTHRIRNMVKIGGAFAFLLLFSGCSIIVLFLEIVATRFKKDANMADETSTTELNFKNIRLRNNLTPNARQVIDLHYLEILKVIENDGKQL